MHVIRKVDIISSYASIDKRLPAQRNEVSCCIEIAFFRHVVLSCLARGGEPNDPRNGSPVFLSMSLVSRLAAQWFDIHDLDGDLSN